MPTTHPKIDSDVSAAPSLMIVSHWDISWAAHYIYRGYASVFRKVSIVCPPHPANSAFDPAWPYHIHPVQFNEPGNYLSGFQWLSFVRTISRENPDIILAFTEPTNSYALQLGILRALRLIRSKVIFYGFENLAVPNSRRNRYLIKPIWKYIDGGAIASEEAINALYASGFPKGHPLAYVPYGTDPELFKPQGKVQARETFGVKGERVVGFIGRLVEEKGILDLVDAIQKLGRYKLCIVGEGDLKEIIQNKLTADEPLSSRTQLLDNVPSEHVPDLINAFDVLVLPSRSASHWKEQWGRVLVEAMATGVPVIGSDSGAIPHVIGDAGLVFPEGDSNALANAIEKILGNPVVEKELIEKGIERARTELSTEAMAKATLELANNILYK